MFNILSNNHNYTYIVWKIKYNWKRAFLRSDIEPYARANSLSIGSDEERMKVIQAMQQSDKAAAKRSQHHNKGMVRGMICRSVGVGMAYHSRVQWPRIRDYLKAKRCEARERLSQRSLDCQSQAD